MPQLPQYLLQNELVGRAGTPALTPQVPVVGQPEAPLGLSQMVGGAFAKFGEALQVTGELAQKTQELREKTAYADRVIKAKKGDLDAAPLLGEMYNKEEENPNYATFPARVQAEGRRIIEEIGHTMDPATRELFDLDVRKRLEVWHQKALDSERGRRKEAGAFVFQGNLEQGRQDILNARTPLERAMAIDAMTETAQRMVASGSAHGTAARELIRKTIEQAEGEETQRANRTMPEKMVPHLLDIAAGGKGMPGLPVPPRYMLPGLIDDAQNELRESREVTHRGDLQAEKDVRLAQDRAESMLTNELYAEANSPNPDLKKLEAIQRKIMGAATERLIDRDGQQRLLGLTGTLIRGLERTKPIHDDPATRLRLENGLLTPSPQYPWPTIEEINDAVLGGKLTPDTGARLIKDRVKLLDDAHPSKIPEVQQGKTRLREAITLTLGPVDYGVPRESRERAPMMQRYLEADRLYDDIVKYAQDKATTPQDKIEAARRIAATASHEITRQYTTYLTAYAQEQLPKLPSGFEAVFQKDGLAEASKAVEAAKDTMSPLEYRLAKENLQRRQELKWEGGTPAKTPTVDPKVSTWESIKKLFGWDTAGTPLVPPGTP